MKTLKLKNSKQKPKQPGFTIIEVVLVLAIAGLIFLMVFVALPALQRSQRDAQRKRDIDRLYSAITRYKSNNRNVKYLNLDSYNGSDARFVDSYLKVGGDAFADPDGSEYYFSDGRGYRGSGYEGSEDGITFTDFNHVIFIFNDTKCDGDRVVHSDLNGFSLSYKLEGGGTYCLSDTGLHITASNIELM